MCRYHVQQDLENCMDETGLDDVFLTIAEELDDLGGTCLSVRRLSVLFFIMLRVCVCWLSMHCAQRVH